MSAFDHAVAAELIGVAQRIRFSGVTAWIAGGISGIFGGMVGNEGDIRRVIGAVLLTPGIWLLT